MNLVGHSSPSFCHDGIEATARRLQRDGFNVWEIVGEGGHAPWEHRREFRQALASTGLKVQLHAPISDCNVGSLVPEVRRLSLASMERAFKGAAAVGCERVTVHPGNHTPLSQGRYGEVHAHTKKALRRLGRLGTELGLRVLVENMPKGWFFGTDSVKKLEDLIDGTEMGICFDVGHAHVSRRLREFPRVAARIGNVHIHDNRGDFDAHLGLDDGTAPWRATVQNLRRRGYRGPWVIESNSHASGAKSRALLKRELDRSP